MKNLKKITIPSIGFFIGLLFLYILTNIFSMELGFLGWYTPKTYFLNEQIENQRELTNMYHDRQEYWQKEWEKQCERTRKLLVDSVILSSKLKEEQEMSLFFEKKSKENLSLYIQQVVLYKDLLKKQNTGLSP